MSRHELLMELAAKCSPVHFQLILDKSRWELEGLVELYRYQAEVA